MKEWKTIKEEKIGHTITNNDCITILDGKAERGKPRTPFMKQIIENIIKTNYKELKVAL